MLHRAQLRPVLLAALASVTFFSPGDAAAWDTPEHMMLCQEVPFPPQVAQVTVAGFVPHEWCALPDYAMSIGALLQQGPCASFYMDEHWPTFAVAGLCADTLLHNNAHFGAFAYSHWHYYHQFAKQAAQKYASSCTPGCDDVAFALEGWALHFLTDAFAAGHAWNPLGDYETPEGIYWMTHSAEENAPDPLFPPPGGINIFRRQMHDHLNNATLVTATPVQFADAYGGPNVVGDHEYWNGLAPAQQVAWTVSRAKAAIWEIYWELLGVNGQGGCALGGVCTPDYTQGYLDQGNAWQCIPFVSNGSWEAAFVALGANFEAYTYYGDCGFLPATAHDCTFNPSRPIPFWSGSLHLYGDTNGSSVVQQMGCDLGDPTVYDGGACLEDKWNKSAVVDEICNGVPAGTCDFQGDCPVPDPDDIGGGMGGGPASGGSGPGGAGPGSGGGAASGNGSGAGNGAGGAPGSNGGSDGGSDGCSCSVPGGRAGSAWSFLALAALTAALRARRGGAPKPEARSL